MYLPFSDWFRTANGQRPFALFQINRCMVITIRFRFDIIRFQKYFCKVPRSADAPRVKVSPHPVGNFYIEKLMPLGIMRAQLRDSHWSHLLIIAILGRGMQGGPKLGPHYAESAEFSRSLLDKSCSMGRKVQ